MTRYKNVKVNRSEEQKESFNTLLCTYPIIPSFVHVCIYFEWFSLWLFLELDSL